MFNSFLLAYNELPSVLNNDQRQNYLLINYSELEQLTAYLKSFHDVIEKLSCDQSPTIHLVIPYKQLLLNRSNRNDDDYQDLVQLKRYMSNYLKEYWIIHDIHFIAMLLHPNLKSFKLAPGKKEHAIELLKVELDKLMDPAAIESIQSSMTNNKDKNKVRRNIHLINSLDEIFDVPGDDEENMQQQPIEKTELDRYLADETKIENNMNLLQYWDANKSIYPNLARVAKKILAIPASNTSVERLFSDTGNTIIDRRTRLDVDKINNLLFIKRNTRTLKEIYAPVVDLFNKRKINITSTDSTPSTPSTKKVKLTTENQENDETIDEDDNDEQI
ncbi:unnamed protein product [Rotaria sp. Silwood1]|nr:unnamed protein product [Rotaria sp. Silwood1]CAF3933474.1 unnamed protein product [Rotaria sp. Silwood1]CAF4826280.1 unnamed protein product [Rotaria sp. Silwood1]CAF4831253.1 unnamed protein product [Rotaria sp. Silwood1]